MHEYDAALKSILTRPGSSVLAQLTGASSLKWINVEAPKVSNRLQSGNKKDFPLRMAEYLFGIGLRYGRLPRQIVLYVAEAPLRLKDRVEGPNVSVRFHLVDIRDLDGEHLLTSTHTGDNVLALQTRLGEKRETVRRYWSGLPPGGALNGTGLSRSLFIIAGLRRMEDEARREATKMPVLNDIMDNKVIGPAIRQGRAEGRAEGRVEGQVEIVLSLIHKRFGTIPPAVGQRVAALKPTQLKRVAARLLDAHSIEDLFAR